MEERDHPAPEHVLVVGGSGMLRGVCLRLAAHGAVVSVIARTERRLLDLERTADELPGVINPVTGLDHVNGQTLSSEPVDYPAADSGQGATEEGVVGCEVVLFHSVLGLRPAVLEWAEWLRAAGHRVTTPDFFEGKTFSDYGEAAGALEAAGGLERYVEWTLEVGRDLPEGAVFLGFSNGAASAELLAATRPSSRGAVLMHGALPLQRLGLEEWPQGVPVQVHYAASDPYRSVDAIAAFESSVKASGARYEYFSYPGAGHLFADRDLPEFEGESARLMTKRVSEFLDAVCRKK